ncbi:major facilitator superfamily domain-containing protein 6-like isoform X2 [Apostichopus japonicus]|uniref:major facilitator superfamily domain-containing protein 6-like isoform X2 n=1 Tax=Stichopus japonicus TaxID=307972 RepID=UPI003AB4242F
MAPFKVNEALLPLKLSYLFYFAGLACVFPYLPVYFVSLGVTVWQVGILRGIDPILALAFSPIWGACADKFSRHRLALNVGIVGTGICYFSFMFVPYIARPFTETTVVGSSNCTSDLPSHGEYPTCRDDQNFGRYGIDDVNNTYSFKSMECLDICTTVLPPRSVQTIGICTNDSSRWNCATCNVDEESTNATDPKLQHLKIMACLSPTNGDWFPEQNLQSGEGSNIGVHLKEIGCLEQLVCCQCELKHVMKTETSSRAIFFILFVLVFASNSFDCNVLSFVDATIMDLLGEREDRYGKQRVWGAVGWGCVSFLGGLAVDVITKATHSSELRYEPLFIIFAAAMLLMLLTSCYIHFPEHQQPRNLTKDLLRVSLQPRVMVFILVVAVQGASLGMSYSFVMIYWQTELGASITLLGLSMLVTTIAEMPILYCSGSIISKIRYQGVVYLTLLAYAIRFILYAIIRNPWAVLPVQLLNGITFGIGWPGFTMYANQIAPVGMSATLQSIKSSSHFGIGFILGNFLGGYIYDQFGPRALFFGNAVVLIGTGVVFFLVDTALRTRDQDNEMKTTADNHRNSMKLMPISLKDEDEKAGTEDEL